MSKLFTAVEDYVEQDYSIPSEQDLSHLRAEIHEHALEIDESVAEIIEHTDVEIAARKDIGELTKIGSVLEGSLADGTGLSEDAAKIAATATESICARLNYKPKVMIVPAIEAFASTNTKQQATSYALEGIKETIANAWAAIKEFFANIWNKIKEVIAKITGQNKRIKKTLEDAEKTLSKYLREGYAQKDKAAEIDRSKYIVPFSIHEGEDPVTEIVDVLSAHKISVSAAEHVLSLYEGVTEEFSKNGPIKAKLWLEDAIDSYHEKEMLDYGFNKTLVSDKDGYGSLLKDNTDLKLATKYEGTTELKSLREMIDIALSTIKNEDLLAKKRTMVYKQTEILSNELSEYAEDRSKYEQYSSDDMSGFMQMYLNIVKVEKLYSLELPALTVKVLAFLANYVSDNLNAYELPGEKPEQPANSSPKLLTSK